ncbi:MAG: holo-ACP synthase [Lachnospiraceae bacterium]|nr:holo-ACP synthase [Lachnospiraceae bacterium]
MIVGIGVDIVDINRIIKMLEQEEKSAFIRRVYTQAEKDGAPKTERLRPLAEYYAGRYAVKEAVFKAVSPYSGIPVDLRKIETLKAEDGHPYVNINEDIRPALDAAGISRIHISITHEKDYAAAFAVAEG